jgi:hypothetical protein
MIKLSRSAAWRHLNRREPRSLPAWWRHSRRPRVRFENRKFGKLLGTEREARGGNVLIG